MSSEEEWIYPQIGQPSFFSFLKKIGMGLFFSFLPSITYYMISQTNLFHTWGIATLLVSGIFLLAGVWTDLSKTSAKKSYKRYEERKELMRDTNAKYKFELGLLQFGSSWEYFGAGICLFAIATIFFRIAI